MLVNPFIPFLLLVLALYATPGPATLSIAASGSAFGFRNTIAYTFGIVTGLVTIFLMIALGLGYIFSQYPLVHSIFKWLGFAYILYLAYKIAFAKPNKSEKCNKLGYWQGVLLSLFNPKAYFAVIATVAQFTVAGEGYYESFIVLIIWVTILTLIIDFVWAYLGAMIGSRFGSDGFSPTLNIMFSVLLVGSVVVTMFL